MGIGYFRNSLGQLLDVLCVPADGSAVPQWDRGGLAPEANLDRDEVTIVVNGGAYGTTRVDPRRISVACHRSNFLHLPFPRPHESAPPARIFSWRGESLPCVASGRREMQAAIVLSRLKHCYCLRAAPFEVVARLVAPAQFLPPVHSMDSGADG